MVLEGYVHSILERIFGQYLEGMDKKNLKIGLLSGNANLKNLKLKSSLLSMLKLPFIIKHSIIKKLKLRVPSYLNIFSQPLELSLETVLIVLGPIPKNQWEPIHSWTLESKQELIKEFIQSMAEKLLDIQKLIKAGKDSSSKESQAEDGYFYQKALKVIDNVQITIKNIHIRYEDEITIKERPFSLGFTLQELSAQTTNDKWQVEYFDRSKPENKSKPVQKFLSIKGFAVYVNTLDTHIKPELGEKMDVFIPRFEKEMFEMFPINQEKIVGASYFIEPINLNAQFMYLTRLERDKPMYSMEIIFHERNITLAKDQYEVMIKLADFVKAYSVFIETSQSVKKYKFMRPIFPVLHDSTRLIPISQRQIKPSPPKKQMTIKQKVMKEEAKKEESDSSFLSLHTNDEESKFMLMRSETSMFEDALDDLDDIESIDKDKSFSLSSNQKDGISKSSSPKKKIQNFNAVDWWQFAIKSVTKDNRSKIGYWSEFKIDQARKHQYALHLVKLVYRYLNKNFEIDFDGMKEEEKLLFKHIVEANEIVDIKSWIGIGMNRKHQVINEFIRNKKYKKKDAGNVSSSFSVTAPSDKSIQQSSNFFGFGSKSKHSNLATNNNKPRQEEITQSKDIRDTITYTEFEELGNEDEADQIALSKEELDNVIDWLNTLLEGNKEEEKGDSISNDGFTLEERNKIVKFSLKVKQGKGQITLTDKEKYSIRLYQNDLLVKYDLKMDSTFFTEINNKSVGIEIETFTQRGESGILSDFRDNQIKRIIWPLEEEKQMGQNNLWEVSIEKIMDLGIGSFIDINVKSRPLKMCYDAIAFSKLQHFFKTDDVSEEIRAQVYDKYQTLKDKTETSVKELFQEQPYRLKINIASPLLEIPFHSTLIDIPKHELEAQNYDRMWLVYLGNISFKTPDPLEKQNLLMRQASQLSQQPSDDNLPFDMYERFSIKIEKVSVEYAWLGGDRRKIKVLREIELSFDIGVQNQTRAALLIGDHAQEEIEMSRPPALSIEGKIPQLELNITPDVYNGLINLSKILSQNNANENLKLLLAEKESLIKECSFRSDVKIKGINRRNGYFEPYHVIMSGSFIYFYKLKSDLVPQKFLSITETQLVLPDSYSSMSKQMTKLMIKPRYGNELHLQFPAYTDFNQFIRAISYRQTISDFSMSYMQGDTSQQKNIEMLRQDPRDAKLGLSLELGHIELRMHKTDDLLLMEEYFLEKKQWMTLEISQINVNLKSFTYDSKIQIRLAQLCFRETEHLNTDILRNEEGANLCEIDVNSFDVFSPNFEDTELDVKIRLGKIFFLLEPYTINNLVKFLRYIKYQESNEEVEVLYSMLKNEGEEKEKEKVKELNKNKFNVVFEEVKKDPAKTCETVKILFTKVEVDAQGISILNVHHLYPKVPIFIIQVGRNIITYDMFFDHDIINIDFTNVQVFDCTRYPKTINPAQYPKSVLDHEATLQNLDVLIREGNEILGINKNTGAKQLENGIKVECRMYRPGCPFESPERQTHIIIDISSVKIYYTQELIFRILDYFFDKFLWSITDADPYSTKVLRFLDAETHVIPQNFRFIDNSLIKDHDLKQIKSTSVVDIKVHRPVVVIKDRPYNDSHSIEVDLGEISIGFLERTEEGRFIRYPAKKAITNTMIIDAKQLSVRMLPEKFVMAEPFDMKARITNLAFSPEIEKIDSREFNKSGNLEIEIVPQLNLHLAPELYMFLLRCNDLNMGYTDSLSDQFNFRLNMDFFRSKECLPKLNLVLTMPYMVINIYNQKPLRADYESSKLTELVIKDSKIAIFLYLDDSTKMSVQFQSISSYFLDEQQEYKHLLFGDRPQQHSLNADYDLTQIESQQNVIQQIPQLLVDLQMQPNGGRKTMTIGVNQLKLIFQPYYFLMLQHFFQENMPTYDDDDFDKPNMFTSDIEDTGELTCIIVMDKILICFKGEKNGQLNENEQVIGCLTQVEYKFSREKIKKAKNKVIEEAEKVIKQQKSGKSEQQPYFWMQLSLKEFNPFICQYGDLEKQDLNLIKKRQIVEPFSLTYLDAKFITWKPNEQLDKLFNKSKQELILKKLLFKLSLTDYLLIGDIYSYFNSSFERFNSLFQKAKLAINMLNTYTAGQFIERANTLRRRDATKIGDIAPKKSNLIIEEESKSNEDNDSEFLGYQNDGEEEVSKLIINPHFNVEKYDISDFKIRSDGMYGVLINDLDGIFYPVLSFAITQFVFKSSDQFERHSSQTQLKLISSYYNLKSQIWEPFIEKLRLDYKQASNQELALTIHKELNVNITTELLSNIIQTINSVQRDQGVIESHDQIKQRLREAYSMTAALTSVKEKVKSKQPVTQGLEVQLEQKLTLFTFVNLTSKNLTVYKINSNSKKTKFKAKPGQSVDFEVNYQEEASRFDHWHNEELESRKAEICHIKFDGLKSYIKNVNLRDQNYYHHMVNEREYVAYGIQMVNLKKMLIVRNPNVLVNNTFQIYRLKFLTALTQQQPVEVKTIDLLPGASQPLDKADEKLKIQFAPILENATSLINLQWSAPAGIKTLVHKLQLNTDSYIENSPSHYTIINKQNGIFKKTFDIILKSPILLINCLPFTLHVKKQSEYDQMSIPVGGQTEYFNSKLDKTISFQFNIGMEESNYQEWSDIFQIDLSNYKSETVVKINDKDLKTSQQDIHVRVDKCKSSGIRLSIFSKNVIVNNTPFKFKYMYNNKEGQIVAGQRELECNNIQLVNDVNRLYLQCEGEQVKKTKYITESFNLDQLTFNNRLSLKVDDSKFYELHILTSLSPTVTAKIETKITTIHPSQILVNMTNFILSVSDLKNTKPQQLEPAERAPLVWSDNPTTLIGKNKLVKSIKFKIEDDDSYIWSCPIKVNEVGKDTYLQWSEKEPCRHIQVEKFVDRQTQICFIIFKEERLQKQESLFNVDTSINRKDTGISAFGSMIEDRNIQTVTPTYIINNEANDIEINVYQRSFEKQAIMLDPKRETLFSWSNPEQNVNRRIMLDVRKVGQQEVIESVEIQPDDLDFKHIVKIPPPKNQLLAKEVQLHIYTHTDGNSLITTLTYHLHNNCDHHSSEDPKIEQKQSTLELFLDDLNLSLICRDSLGERKEFLLLNLNGIHLFKQDQNNESAVQFKINYLQLDNNMKESKTQFPTIIYPNEIYSRKDYKEINRKLKGPIPEQKEFLNLHLQLRTDKPNVTYIESFEFLMQSLVIKLDDEFIVYVLRFMAAIEEDGSVLNIGNAIKGTKIHQIFMPKILQSDYELKYRQLCEESKLFDIQERSSEEQSDGDQSQKTLKKIQSFDDISLLKTPVNKKQVSQRFIQQRNSDLKSSTDDPEQTNMTWMALQLPQDSAKVYIKNFNSGPIEIKLSVVTSAKLDMDGDTAQKKFSLRDCGIQYGLNLINTESASIQLNALEISNIFGSQYHISNQLTNHYIERAKKNILKLLFSVNMLGDPVSFISHIGTGVKDFYYEPKKGFIKGPLEGGKGILKGTYSLIKNPIEGSFDTVSKFLSSMSKGMLYFTDDQGFINQRQEDNKFRPHNPIEGLGFGVRSALTGVAQGITGVIEKPIQGAQSQGFKGLMTGTLKGLGGLVIMPVSGAIDLVSKTSEGFKNLISSDERQVSKLRIVRPFYGDNQSIKIYYGFHAYIIQHLIKLNRQKYAQDHFIDAIHFDQDETKHVIIFTEENLILVDGVKKQLLYESLSSDVFEVLNTPAPNSSLMIFFKSDLTKQPFPIIERGQLKRDSKQVNVDVLKIEGIQDQIMREAFKKKIENYIRRMQEKNAIQINNQ